MTRHRTAEDDVVHRRDARDTGQPPALSWRGRAALALTATNVALQFVPPIPPLWKGSIWSYLIAYAAVWLAVLELHRMRTPLLRRWDAMPPARQFLAGGGMLATLLLLGLALHAALPEVFSRWSGEEGVWEPLTVFSYVAGGTLLLSVAKPLRYADRRHLRLIGVVYVLLALEEVDYFGIVGSVIGRIDGVYVGSPHDLLRLWEQGLLPLTAVLLIGAVLAGTAVALWIRGYIQPVRLLRIAVTPAMAWFVVGAALIGLGQVEDAELLRLTAPPSLEELLEATGAVSLFIFALTQAAPAFRPAAPSPRTPQAVGMDRRRTETLQPLAG